MQAMTDEQIQTVANFYGIDMEEAKRRYNKVQGQADNPDDPICIGCAKRPEEDGTYSMMAIGEECTPKEYVIENEGTFNRQNGHYLCDECYIKNGSPSSERGWVCP